MFELDQLNVNVWRVWVVLLLRSEGLDVLLEALDTAMGPSGDAIPTGRGGKRSTKPVRDFQITEAPLLASKDTLSAR